MGFFDDLGSTLGLDGKSRINPNNANGSLDSLNKLAQSSDSGLGASTAQIGSNPILGSLFGSGGQLSKAEGNLDSLNSQGFKLQPEDVEAYGQESGNIARMFGQAGNDLSSNLAGRGLSAAPTGAAGAMFSGLQGSQNEQLKQAQMQIAQQRMQTTMQRIRDTQNFTSALGGQAQGAIQGQQTGTRQGLATAAGLQQGANEQDLKGQVATEEYRNPTLGGMLGQGLGSTAYNFASAPGKFASSVAGMPSAFAQSAGQSGKGLFG